MAKKKAKGKTKELIYTASVVAPGFRVISGTLVKKDENSITFSYRKPRTQRQMEQVFPLSEVIFCTAEEGSAGEICAKTNSADVEEFEGTMEIDEVTKMIIITPEDGEPVLINRDYASVIAEDESGGKKSNRGRKAAKDDDGDDEDSSPKKSKGKKGKKKK